MQSTHDFSTISDDELLRRVATLVASSRRTEADLVAHIREVDARRLYLRQATSSMFVYCTERLHLSEAEACLRIAAARASRQHPVLLPMLADGRLHLSAIAKLAPQLTPENRDELLRRATHRTKREIDELVAEVAPLPDVPASVRKLPADRFVVRPASDRLDLGSEIAQRASGELRPERVDSGCLVLVSRSGAAPIGAGSAESPDGGGRRGRPIESGLHCGVTPGAGRGRSDGQIPDGGAAPEDDPCPDGRPCPDEQPRSEDQPRSDVSPHSASGLRWVTTRPRPAAIEPLPPARYRVQFTASAELRDKLERLQDRRFSIPDGDLAAVIDAAVSEKLERLEARRFGRAKSPKKSVSTSDTKPRTRHVPAAVRRAVDERDGGRCSYVDAEGHRCTARVWIELHHRIPWAVGGDHSPSMVSTLCSAHNRYLAEIDFGREAVGRLTPPAAGRSRPRRTPPPTPCGA